MNILGRWVAIAIWLVGIPIASTAQEVNAVLDKAAAAMSATSAKTIRFSVAGSGYEVQGGVNPSSWRHIRIDNEVYELDLAKPSLRKQNHLITTDSAWEEQFELWTVPQVFLNQARKSEPFLGEFKQGDALYNLVIFKVQDNLVSGYFNSQNLLEMVETRIKHPVLGDTPVKIVYTEYRAFGGVKFPSTIILKLGGSLVSVLVVSDVIFQ